MSPISFLILNSSIADFKSLIMSLSFKKSEGQLLFKFYLLQSVSYGQLMSENSHNLLCINSFRFYIKPILCDFVNCMCFYAKI